MPTSRPTFGKRLCWLLPDCSHGSIRQIQIDKLTLLKQTRDKKAVTECLGKIKLIAKGNENLMPAVIEAVENYCTLGEIADSLREIYGEFK